MGINMIDDVIAADGQEIGDTSEADIIQPTFEEYLIDEDESKDNDSMDCSVDLISSDRREVDSNVLQFPLNDISQLTQFNI